MNKRKYIFYLCFGLIIGCQPEQKLSDRGSKIYFLLGDVSVNGKTAQINQNVQDQDLIQTGAESRAEIRLGSSGGFQIRENTQAQIVQNGKGWEVMVKTGSVLNLVERGRNYRLRGPTAVVAVRGTIFYVHCYEDGSQYMCTCNGTVEIEYEAGIKKVSASHHKPYTIRTDTETSVLKDDQMKEHNDEEIFDFMYRLDQAIRSE